MQFRCMLSIARSKSLLRKIVQFVAKTILTYFEGIAVLVITQAELAFKVRTPHLVWLLWIEDGVNAFDSAPSFPRLHQVVTLEN